MIREEQLGPDMVLIRRQDVVTRVLDNQAILLCPETRRPFRLNEAGVRIWEMMDRPMRVEEMVASIQQSYQVDRDEALPDVLAFLGELISTNLVTKV
ncbi:MAG: PqqD family protein [Deltaproteobacteria bacterium]|nr:PqqD family protein [Deltaproteobacteria bacterium]